jgi:transketolase
MEFMSASIKVREIASANVLRLRIAEMIFSGGEGHIPSSFSILDIVRSIYCALPELGQDLSSTKFVLSKGHGSAALYVVLNSCGLLPDSYISNYGKPGSKIGGHPERQIVPAIEASTGSLGHGFPFAVGLSLSTKIKKTKPSKIISLVGDGECQEGTIWEAAAIAANQKLGNMLVFVDWNGSAAQLQPLESLAMKWESCGWKAVELDGHDCEGLIQFLINHDFSSNIPTVVLAKTTKGKGVSFMEGHGAWHHKLPNLEEMNQIRAELAS